CYLVIVSSSIKSIHRQIPGQLHSFPNWRRHQTLAAHLCWPTSTRLTSALFVPDESQSQRPGSGCAGQDEMAACSGDTLYVWSTRTRKYGVGSEKVVEVSWAS
ncbi:hypothetical protein CLAIMM_10240, partial [Cladophialophora immunda]